MKTRFSFIDPGVIMGIVVSLIILGVGVFAFYVTTQSIFGVYTSVNPAADTPANLTKYQMNLAANNTTGIGNQVFNIIGIVMIIGAIMSIVGLVYQYVR